MPVFIHDRFIAIAVACIVIAQTLFAGWALGATSQHAALDAFGNPLCISSTDDGSHPSGGHSGFPNCCTFGCSMVSPVLFTKAMDNAGLRLFSAGSEIVAAIRKDIVVPARDYDPGKPRAPPQTV